MNFNLITFNYLGRSLLLLLLPLSLGARMHTIFGNFVNKLFQCNVGVCLINSGSIGINEKVIYFCYVHNTIHMVRSIIHTIDV